MINQYTEHAVIAITIFNSKLTNDGLRINPNIMSKILSAFHSGHFRENKRYFLCGKGKVRKAQSGRNFHHNN